MEQKYHNKWNGKDNQAQTN